METQNTDTNAIVDLHNRINRLVEMFTDDRGWPIDGANFGKVADLVSDRYWDAR
jgi:hypothetical protein